MNSQTVIVARHQQSTRTKANSDTSVTLTAHAIQKAQSRGIARQSILLAAIFGRRTHAGSGRFRRAIGRRQAACLRQTGTVSSGSIEKAVGVTVVTEEASSDILVVTVLPRYARNGLRRKPLMNRNCKLHLKSLVLQ